MRILIADFYALERDALRPFFAQIIDNAEIFYADTMSAALDTVDRVKGIRLVVLDPEIAGGAIAEALSAIRERSPETRVAVLAATSSRQRVIEVMGMGSAAYIPKQLSAPAMQAALRLVIAGERYVPTILVEEEPSQASVIAGSTPVLSPRESEILQLLRDGLSNKLIAQRLNISVVTVKSHLYQLFRKLGVKNRTQAAMAIAV